MKIKNDQDTGVAYVDLCSCVLILSLNPLLLALCCYYSDGGVSDEEGVVSSQPIAMEHEKEVERKQKVYIYIITMS